MIIIILSSFSWKEHNTLTIVQSSLSALEKNILQQQKSSSLEPLASTVKLQSAIDTLQQQFATLSNNIKQTDTIEATESGYQLRATLRLATLAAMHLFLGKEETIAKDLLTQAIDKLIKMNDSRLHPILYKLQDEHANLSDKQHFNYSVQEVWSKIDQVQVLVDKLQKSGLELDDFFAEPEHQPPTPTIDITAAKFLDLIKVNPLPENQDNKTNHHTAIPNNTNQTPDYHEKLSYLKIEMLHIYLEQAKLAYLQNNDVLFKQTLSSITKILGSGLWSPQIMSEIKQQISWLDSVEFRNYSLLLQAILNLEDQLK